MKTATPDDAPRIAELVRLSRQHWTEHTPYAESEIRHELATGEVQMYWQDEQGILESVYRENATRIICMYPYCHPQAPEHVEDNLIAFAKQLSMNKQIPVEISVPESKEREIQKLVSQGYVHARTFYRMHLQGEALSRVVHPRLPQGWEFRKVGPSEFQPLHNDAFRSHYGFSPIPLHTVESWFTAPEHNPEDWQALFVHGKPVAYFAIGKQEDGGHVYLLGTIHEAQGKGHGRMVLQEGCALLRDRGVERIQLGVDTENAHALEFYKRVGFEVSYANYRYRYAPKTLTL